MGAGQFVLAHHPNESAAARSRLFPITLGSDHIAFDHVPSPAWLPGQEIDFLGPLGNPFSPPPAARNWLLLSLGNHPERMLPLLESGRSQSASIALWSKKNIPGLPADVEGPSSPEEAVPWADYVAIELCDPYWPDTHRSLKDDLHIRKPALIQVLINVPTPCGIGGCQACACSPAQKAICLHARRGWCAASRNSVAELTLLAAFAHPDDETILAGGLLAMLANRGAVLHLLVATRGEGGELGEPALAERSGLGQVRSLELRCAAGELGIQSVIFLDYIDPLVGEGEELYPFEADFESLTQEITAAMHATQANALLTHGSDGEYGHPAHALMHRACKFALQSDWGGSVPLYAISADYPDHPRPRLANKHDPAHFVIDIEPWVSTKLQAAACHRSQAALVRTPLFSRSRASLELGGSLDEVRELTLRLAAFRIAQGRSFSRFPQTILRPCAHPGCSSLRSEWVLIHGDDPRLADGWTGFIER